MSKTKKRSNRNVNQLRKLYARPAVATGVSTDAVGAGEGSVNSQPADLAMSTEELRMSKLIRHDIIKTIVVSLILILILSAIYAIRNTALVTAAINQLAVYTGF